MNNIDLVREYLNKKASELASFGVYLTTHDIEELANYYSTRTNSINEIFSSIDQLVERRIDKPQENTSQIKDIKDLGLTYSGITLNVQDIDLMKILLAESPEELQEVIDQGANIIKVIEYKNMSKEEFIEYKRLIFKDYQSKLLSKEEFFKDRSLSLKKKINYLFESDKVTQEEKEIVRRIINEQKTTQDIIKALNEQFSQEQVHKIYEVLRESKPIEKSGIKSTSVEAMTNLIERIKEDYNSITIDEVAKYGNIVLEDGTCDFRDLDKVLEFAKDLDKEVRLNALIFYMDCPDKLYQLDKTPENKKLVKENLTKYVDELTSHLGRYDCVRSIDTFNELFNRFPIDGPNPYEYRGDIEQTIIDGEVPDNIKSGWLKHLNLEDLCDVIAVARKNLPNVDFMYNDDHLVDPNKLSETVKIIKEIQEYEQKHNIKILDSIGTQMHIDNDVSIEKIENMFRTLSTLGLPIEVTELDITMSHGVEGLSSEEIEVLRDQKVNEVLECINKLKEECNIRGCTIWSKTDSQSFRVTLENEKRIREGQEPIETLHSGFYTDKMESKTKRVMRKEAPRPFNYHTHTTRCGHAPNASDQEYVDAARIAGITTLGFSDHVPNTDLEYPQPKNRMHITEVDEYIESINKLREDNPDMTILSGFEAEYDPSKKELLVELRDKVDYLILGQHFVKDGLTETKRENNPNYPIEYAKSICEAIDTGLFDIVAHPDIFMEQLKTIRSEEDRTLFLKNATEAAKMICSKANEMGIPLELNLSGAANDKSYPNQLFWKIAKEENVKVISSADAHHPSMLTTMGIDQEKALKKIEVNNLDFVDYDYNPVIERQKNQKLQEAHQKTKEEAISYEEYISTQLIDNLKDTTPIEEIPNKINELIEKENPQKTIDKIIEDQSIDSKTKKEKLKLIVDKIESPHFTETVMKRKELLQKIATKVKESLSLDHTPKEETPRPVKRDNSDLQEMFKMSDTPTKKQEKSTNKVLRIDKPNNNNSNNNKSGYIETISIPTIILFISIIIIILTIYLIIK